VTDNLDRGLVAVNMGGSTFLSWRILADEYFGVTYNVYRDGVKLNTEPLTVSNYTDSGVGTNYMVKAVVNGMEQSQSASISSLWPVSAKGNSVDKYLSGRIDLTLTPVYDRNGNDVTANYSPNDAEFADLDGDGQLEMIIKRLNTVDAANVYPQSNTTEFVMLDAYNINWQTGTATLMWRIDCGPNMVSLNSTEINIIAFDWDEDGKAEVVLRGADNMIVYGNDGRTRLYTIGDMSVNTRDTFDPANGAQYAWTHSGNEYLLYLNGQTGALYQQTTYPLLRLEYATTLSAEWGGRGYGHNSSKYFFGAPYLDGHTPNLFLARGIYGTHKMIAMNLNKNTHTWSERWRWNCNDTNSPWYGQGYHNFIVADVDEDGRDEIVYGSMVIDDNGKGLYTTGFGHGDAQHVSDFDPYRKGMEFMGCLEDKTGFNYRNATTGKIYRRELSDGDDGRCMMANISNIYPGSLGHSASSQTISSVTNGDVSDASSIFHFKTTNISLNFRIYWDGDLLSELLDSPGTMSSPMIFKPGGGRLLTGAVGNMNNDSKNNPCFQGDLIGDWREEIVVRNGTNAVSIYTSIIPSENAIPCLWLDHQYRQAMVWQMMAYNQPPHLSYFLGEMEGYTQAPPPLTTQGKEVVGNNTNINGNYNGKHVLHNEYSNTSLSISGGTPSVLTINVPALVQGNDNNNITTTTFTCNLTGGAMSGATRLVKQGNGILNMSNANHTNSGETDIWGGTVNFDGTMQNSKVWMNRYTTLNTTGGTFNNGLKMEYGATLNVGGTQAGNCSRANISELTLNYGARVVLDVNGMEDADHDWLNATTLNIDDSKVGIDAWENYGPEDIVPVFKLNMASPLGNGRYPIGNVATVNGDLSKVKIECDAIDARYLSLIHEGGILYLQVSDVATATEATIEITGMAPYETVSTLYPSASSDNYYLPVVSIVANNTDGQVPTLSGTFTSLDGTVTNIGSTAERDIFNEDFEEAESIDDINNWTIGSFKYLNKNDVTYKNYLNIASENSSGNRRSYKTFYATGNNFYGSSSVYTIEFDALFHRTNTDNVNELVLFGEGATMPVVNEYFNSKGNNYLFRLTGGNNNTNYTVEGSEATASIGDSWCHYTISVNKSTRMVSYSVKQGGATVLSGNYTANEAANLNVQGIGIVVGRAWSYFYIDNIVIKSAGDDMSSYTFTEPGTLRVKSSVEGYAFSVKTFEVQFPFIKTGNSGDISNDYLPVAIHDELATSLPQTVETQGNVHLWRNGLAGTSTWATMVVPFDMTVAQVREVFGEGVTVANLEMGKGNGSQIYFETIDVATASDATTAITANKPCLMKGVTKSAPYLIMGITSEPTTEPCVTNGYFSFVGTYIDLGQHAFTTNDYFFTTSGLSRVETNGTTMRLKGYRGYFQGLTANGAKSIQTVFEKSDVVTGILDVPTTTRNEVYDLQGRKIPENWQQKKGIYIVNGRKMIVK
jgi:autotransporter-associated beta strand protein